MWGSALLKSLGTGFEVLRIMPMIPPNVDLKIEILNPAVK
jgi:hypothetical protein